MSGESSSLIELGVVGAPFGVRGWVKLRSFTDPPDRLLQHRSLQLRVGGSLVPYKVEASGRSGGALTAKVSGVNHRGQAGVPPRAQIWMAAAGTPQRREKDFFWAHPLPPR